MGAFPQWPLFFLKYVHWIRMTPILYSPTFFFRWPKQTGFIRFSRTLLVGQAPLEAVWFWLRRRLPWSWLESISSPKTLQQLKSLNFYFWKCCGAYNYTPDLSTNWNSFLLLYLEVQSIHCWICFKLMILMQIKSAFN